MPYITRDLRGRLDTDIDDLSWKVRQFGGDNARPGLLNYAITKLIKDVYEIGERNLRYHEWNEIIGMLESCKLEMYRKGVAPYEDVKAQENGEVLTSMLTPNCCQLGEDTNGEEHDLDCFTHEN